MSTLPVHSTAWLELPDGTMFWLGPRCAIGRDPGNDVALAAESLSRQHALLTLGADGYSLTDLHSRNGTHVNRRLINRAVVLQDRDELRLGDVVLRYRCTSRRDATTPGFQSATRVLNQVQLQPGWLMLVDVAGYSTLSEQLGSEVALRQMQDWIARVRPLLERQHGTINRYLGDAIFAYWLVESASPVRVLAALRGLMDLLPQSPLPFRVVIHYGPVLFTVSEKGEELSGHEVNFLFRAEKIAKQFGVPAMLSATAVQSLDLAGQCASLGLCPVDGLSGQHEFFKIPDNPGASTATRPSMPM